MKIPEKVFCVANTLHEGNEVEIEFVIDCCWCEHFHLFLTETVIKCRYNCRTPHRYAVVQWLHAQVIDETLLQIR